MYGGREALPDDHKFRGQRGRVRARYRRPQLGRGTEKIGETSQRKTNLQLASGAFSCKVAPFTPAGERTKKAPSRGGRTGSNGQQHPVVIDCEVLQKRRSRCTTPGELRAIRRMVRPDRFLAPPAYGMPTTNSEVGAGTSNGSAFYGRVAGSGPFYDGPTLCQLHLRQSVSVLGFCAMLHVNKCKALPFDPA
jgi:hypothetical protein